jgi:hypothetical protein
MPYNADLPPDMKGQSINTAHPLYKSFEADATARGMSQEAFSSALAAYARASAPAAPKPAAAAPAPAPARPFASLTTQEKFARSLANSAPPKRGG